MMLSEILKAGMPFYYPNTGNPGHASCMCMALGLAAANGHLAVYQRQAGADFCMELVNSIAYRAGFLRVALAIGVGVDLSNKRHELALVYQRVIEWLEENPEQNLEVL